MSLLMPSACQYMPLLPIIAQYIRTTTHAQLHMEAARFNLLIGAAAKAQTSLLLMFALALITMNGFDPNRCLVLLGMVYNYCLFVPHSHK